MHSTARWTSCAQRRPQPATNSSTPTARPARGAAHTANGRTAMNYSDMIAAILLAGFGLCIIVPMAMSLVAMIDDHRRAARHERRVRQIINR